MTKALGDYENWEVCGAVREMIEALVVIDIGGTGAPTIRAGGPPGFSIARTGVGAYTFTAPAVPSGAQAAIFAWMAKTATIFHVVQATESPTTGAYTFALFNNAATPVATEAASGDVMVVEFSGCKEKP